jgi:uncharacterized protein YdeI (YjbR/CyaY-like superfamily)
MQQKIKPVFFRSSLAFRKWLEKNHAIKTEVIVGFFKVHAGKPTLTWPESVDQALCFGWIDGVRKSIDKDRYQIRFTPRKASSIWSAVNILKIETLTKQGLMMPAGIASFQKKLESRSKIYPHEMEGTRLSLVYEKKFKANKKAWKYFQSLAPSYLKTSTHWVMRAKQESTQLKRLQALIQYSEEGTNPWKDNKYKKK